MDTMETIYKALTVDCPDGITETICAQQTIISIIPASEVEEMLNKIETDKIPEEVKRDIIGLIARVDYLKYTFPMTLSNCHTDADIQCIRSVNEEIFDLITAVGNSEYIRRAGLFFKFADIVIGFICIMSVYAHYNDKFAYDFVGDFKQKTKICLVDIPGYIASVRS